MGAKRAEAGSLERAPSPAAEMSVEYAPFLGWSVEDDGEVMQYVPTNQGLIQAIDEHEFTPDVLTEDPEIRPARWIGAFGPAEIANLSFASVGELLFVSYPPWYECPRRSAVQHGFDGTRFGQFCSRGPNGYDGHRDVFAVLAVAVIALHQRATHLTRFRSA